MSTGLSQNGESFKPACTLVQKSYCYTIGVRVHVGIGIHIQNVRANVKVLKLCFTLFTHVPYHFPPYHFAPWKLLNDLHYLPMSRIILPPDSFRPISFSPDHFAPPPWKSFKCFSLFTHIPYHFAPCIRPLGWGCCAF